MKRIGAFFAFIALLSGLLTGCQPSFQPGAYIDDMNRSVTINAAPQRIVSHVPSITETIFALGLGSKLVGRSDYDDYPPEAANITSVGNYFNPSIENIVALNPDLVLTDGHSDTIKQLDNLKINYFVIDPKNLDGIFKDIELVGNITGTETAADKLVADMKSRVAKVQDTVKGAPAPRVIYLLDATDIANPWTAGPGSFVDSLITLGGGQNVAGKMSDPYAQMSMEQIIAADPEIIILPSSHGTAFTAPKALQDNPAWQKTSAVKNGKIYIIDTDLVDRSGPRIVQGLEDMAKLIHPELFK
jgi:iron complex transport system substrate-binding protein